MDDSIPKVATRAKIAISLAPEVLELVDQHAHGRSRSKCIEQELLRALRALEWERLSADLDPDEAAEQLEWAEGAFAAADEALARYERGTLRRPARARRAR
jgi:hypothetical protein